MTPTPAAIWALRSDHLKLSRESFGELFSVKARTIESWEQLDQDDRGRRVPRGMALEKLQRLIRKHGVDSTTQ
jgi:DNA-binding transcriptional regulator YiaG